MELVHLMHLVRAYIDHFDPNSFTDYYFHLYDIINEYYDKKYKNMNNSKKKMFLEFMIGFGTAWCLRRQKQPDSIVHDNAIIHIPICMIQTIEVRDQLRVQD
jgi:hypothetical protein